MQAETAETSETSETVPLRGISEATAAEILAFRDDRRWLPYHNLKADVERLQAAIDRYLILQGRPRRYAVRLNERNEVLALLVLEH